MNKNAYSTIDLSARRSAQMGIKMITKENLEGTLKALGYIKSKKNGIYIKEYVKFDCFIKVDFNEENIIYPEEKGLCINRKTTCNFSEPENFVVLECITRLLDKGYQPKHIELEKPMPGGHHDTGGFCDILIKDNDDRTFLLIECKREDEFDTFWKKMLVNGGQLFNYYNSYRQAQALCLYTSDYDSIKGVTYTSHVVSLVDNVEYLASDKKLRSFKHVQDENGGKDEYFQVWRDTYQQDYNTRGIFENDIEPYTIGKLKYSVDDLAEVDNESIQKKYHEFASILRQHNVSSHENAFDKLINLFLAKIVDESINARELQFRWKGAAHDDFYNLQDRLQKLYKEGMETFLGEEVTYIDQQEINDAFHLFKNDPDATREKVLEYFRKLKFYTNSDFAFLDVHNEELFYQNAVILKKIVQMLEDIRLKTHEQNQFLGDLFEGFLDDGIKQSEGQYFTPTPIVKFLVSSLPLETLIKESKEIPWAIDYACGAGHFLNEYAACIKTFVKKYKSVDVKEYYKHIIGIEKDYRLSKVAKVSAFMYGQPDIEIIYGDALVCNKKMEEDKFSVLVANPPYSVKGFLETLSESDRECYALSAQVSDVSRNNSIETFFVERAKQLLAPKGIAAIVLPSSVLSNPNIYISCREILLKYFDIVAIAEFGSGTFGKTITNTATFFLQRKTSNPDMAEHYKNRVDSWFNADNSKDVVFEDNHMIGDYCNHCGINLDEYKNWMCDGSIPCATVFAEYRKKVTRGTSYKNIKKKKITAKYTQDDQNKELEECIKKEIKELEKEKLYYFLLAQSNEYPVLVVKSPVDSKEIKNFLGYDWSGAKGNEGIKYIGAPSLDSEDVLNKNKGINSINTPLFDPHDFDNSEKINYLIRRNFEKEDVSIPDTLKSYVAIHRLTDMIDFSRVEFNKAIRTTVQDIEERQLFYKYETVALEKLLIKVKGNTTKISTDKIVDKGEFPVITQSRDGLIAGYCNNQKPVTDVPLIVFGDHSCTYKYVDFKFVRGADGTQLIKVDESRCNIKYLYYFLQQIKIQNAEKYERHYKYLKETQVPLPPRKIQEQIVAACEILDKQYELAIKKTDRNKKRIEKIISETTGVKKSIKDICRAINPSKAEIRGIDGDKLVSFVEMESVSADGYIERKVDIALKDLRKGSYTYFAENDIIIAKITPCMENGKCALTDKLTNKIGMGSSEFHVFRADEDIVLRHFLFYSLNRESIRLEAAKHMTGSSGHRRVPESFYENLIITVPGIDMQKKIIAKIKKLISENMKNKEIMSSCLQQRRELIKSSIHSKNTGERK